ncbi:MAG: TIGR04255 family protein [Pseudonocardia sp.]
MNEVVTSISFKQQAVLDGPRLMVGLVGVLDELPKVDEVPPYEMADEQPFEEQVLRPAIPQIQFVGPHQLQRRLWFTDPNSPALLLQAQPDYLALNWRRQAADHSYPGFRELKRQFLRYLGIIEQTCIRLGGEPLSVTRVEITYLNLLKPDTVWGSFRDIGNVVSVVVPAVAGIEQLNVVYSRSIEDESGGFFGRLHAAITTGYQPKVDPETELRPLSIRDLSPTVNVSITARSGSLRESLSSLEVYFNRAHDSVTEEFKVVTTDQARSNWGIN